MNTRLSATLRRRTPRQRYQFFRYRMKGTLVGARTILYNATKEDDNWLSPMEKHELGQFVQTLDRLLRVFDQRSELCGPPRKRVLGTKRASDYPEEM